MPDAPVLAILAAAGAIILVAIVARVLRARREAAYFAARRRELRQTRGYLYMQQQELEQAAGRIVATSSTGTIAGYRVVRQIEAVFCDGQVSPVRAVTVLKAMAAEKGANALINLSGEQLPSGKYVARGDAVIIRPEEPQADGC